MRTYQLWQKPGAWYGRLPALPEPEGAGGRIKLSKETASRILAEVATGADPRKALRSAGISPRTERRYRTLAKEEPGPGYRGKVRDYLSAFFALLEEARGMGLDALSGDPPVGRLVREVETETVGPDGIVRSFTILREFLVERPEPPQEVYVDSFKVLDEAIRYLRRKEEIVAPDDQVIDAETLDEDNNDDW